MSNYYIINPNDLPKCSMTRLIIHWTVGNNTPNDTDLLHYHYVVGYEKNTKTLKHFNGTHSIADNVSTNDGKYAAHTRNLNRGSIGVSICGMVGATEKGGDGKQPITKEQLEYTAKLVADLCRFYDIPMDRNHVMTHAEVEERLGVKQAGKWDIDRLPWNKKLNRKQVHEHIFNRISELYNREENYPVIKVVFESRFLSGIKPEDRLIPGTLINSQTYVLLTSFLYKVDKFSENGFGYVADELTKYGAYAENYNIVRLPSGKKILRLMSMIKIKDVEIIDVDGTLYVNLRQLSTQFNFNITYNKTQNKIYITSKY